MSLKNAPCASYRLSIKSLLLAGVVSLGLTACQSATMSGGENGKIDSTLEKVASEAGAQGYTMEQLSALEQLYKRDSQNPKVALNYATALQQNGRLKRAELILQAFAEDQELKSAPIKAEYAAIQAASGNYISAEDYARKALLIDQENGKAYEILGISLDAQSKYDQAESAYRKALDNWSGNPSTVLNNLGLNLASQGFFDEAMEELRKALATAPNRDEIERNMRIVSALQSAAPFAGNTDEPPHPGHKPKFNQ